MVAKNGMFDSFLKFAIIQRCFESIPILQVSCFKGAETIAGSAVTLGNAFSKTDAPDVFSSSSSEPLSYELGRSPYTSYAEKSSRSQSLFPSRPL